MEHMYLSYLISKIHSVVLATTDERNNPITCVIDMMLADNDSLYFLTAKGKALYKRLLENENISLTGFQGEDTMSSKSITIRGKTKEHGSDLLGEIFKKNTYMYDIYPNEESRKALTVFQIYEGDGEFFDLSVLPIFRERFSFGKNMQPISGYCITDRCTTCGQCVEICPQSCIKLEHKMAVIDQNHCLHCGSCFDVCTNNAVRRMG